MDDIQRKLALIDEQLSGGFINSYQRIITTSPLLFAAVGLIIGILIQHSLFDSRVTSNEPLFLWFWFTALILTAMAVFLLFSLSAAHYTLYANLALICFVCLGAIRLISFHQSRPNDIRNLVNNEQKLATIRGLIVTEPYINKNQQWAFAQFTHTDPTTSFYLKMDEVKTINGWAKVSGTVRVQINEPVLDFKAGDYIQAYCWLDKFKPPTNPGQFDTADYLARRNIYIAASAESRSGLELLGKGSAAGFTKIRARLRQIAVQALLDSPYPQDQNQSLLQALVLGYRADIDSKTYIAFRQTGLLHFVCLSGMNFGIFVGMIWWLCKTAGLTRKAQAAVCMIATAMFVLVVPSNPPAFRAAIICLVFCLSFFFRRQSNPFNSLALAAVILLMIKPTDLFEVSWQLSFAAVLGILLFTDRIHFLLYEKITDNLWFEQIQKIKSFAWAGSMLLNLFCISLAAWLASAGILLYNFYTIQPLTSIWTVVASPFIAVISFLGYLKLLIGLVLPTAASILDVIIKPLSSWLIWLVKYIAQRDYSPVLIGHIAIWLIVFYYCTILFIPFIHFKRPFLKKLICVTAALAIIVPLGITKWQRTHRDSLTITCFDVAHGQAILSELPGKTNVLFDTGSLYENDIGTRIVSAFLNYTGINKIDAIIISHNNVDHINAIPEIIEQYKVYSVYANEAFFSSTDQWGTAKFLDEWLSKKGLKVQHLDKDLNITSTADIKILWPTEKIYQNEELADNDRSTVSLIEFAGRKILLCSDIEKFAQNELLKIYPNLKVDIIIVPHHGSTKTLNPGFLENLQADTLIYSCGQKQYEGQKTIGQKNNSKLLYTARDGAITIRINKDGDIKTDAFVKQKNSLRKVKAIISPPSAKVQTSARWVCPAAVSKTSLQRISLHVNDNFNPAVLCFTAGGYIGSNRLAISSAYRPNLVFRNSAFS
jgi:competence protein ComEC